MAGDMGFWKCGQGHRHASTRARDECDAVERDRRWAQENADASGGLAAGLNLLDDPVSLPDTSTEAGSGADFGGFSGGESGGGGGGGSWGDSGSSDSVGDGGGGSDGGSSGGELHGRTHRCTEV